MNAENLNRAAMWGTISILVIASAVFAGRWAFGNSDDSETAQGVSLVQVSDPSSTPEGKTATAASRPTEPRPETTTTRPLASIVLGATLETVAPGTPEATDPSVPSTTEPVVVVEVPGIETTTTGPPPEPTTTLPAGPTTTTTTTTTTSTTTTVPVSTTTTTTAPATTTTTTVASAAPGIFLKKFDGRAQAGDADEWTVRLDITLDGTVDGAYSGRVFISWAGGAGSSVVNTASNGKARATVGPFSGSSVTLSVTNVLATDWVYVPSLNQASSSLSFAAPGG